MTLLTQCLNDQTTAAKIKNTHTSFNPDNNNCTKIFTSETNYKIPADVYGVFAPLGYSDHHMVCKYKPVRKECIEREKGWWVFPGACKRFKYSYNFMKADPNHEQACKKYLNNNTGFGMPTEWSYNVKKKTEPTTVRDHTTCTPCSYDTLYGKVKTTVHYH